MSNDLVKCNKCKKDKEINCFMKKDKQLKMCDKCLENKRLNTKKNLCDCGREKFYCKIHGDARRVVIHRILVNSRYKDKLLNLFDENQFIDKQFVSNLLDLYKNCIYCNCELNFDKCNPQLATIERLDSSLGHIKRNCVIACSYCNSTHVGKKYN